MAVEIVPYSPEHVDAVCAFNRRLTEQQSRYSFHEVPVPLYADTDGRLPYQEYFLALDGDAVRGGYQLKRQEIVLKGRVVAAAAVQLPVSEGIIDGRFALVGVRLIQDALQRAPLLYALGMTSADSPFARMLVGMGWVVRPVPLFARIVRAYRFLRNARVLRRTRLRSFLFDVAAFSGMGWAAAAAYRLRARGHGRGTEASAAEVERVDAWADELWVPCRDAYSLIGVRDGHYLDVFFTSDRDRFRVLRVSDGNRAIGWAVTFVNDTVDHKYFGNLRVASIVDVLAAPEDAFPVVRSATEYLERAGADLIITNQSHRAWGGALASTGYKSLPSTFMFGVSKPLAAELGEAELDEFHLNRGDAMGGIMDPQLWGDHPVRHLDETPTEAGRTRG